MAQRRRAVPVNPDDREVKALPRGDETRGSYKHWRHGVYGCLQYQLWVLNTEVDAVVRKQWEES